MKKYIAAIFIIVSMSAIACADEGEKAVTNESPKKVTREVTIKTGASESFSGKVDSVTPADLLTRPRSSIKVVDQAGNSTEFTVKALAVIYDKTGRFLTLNDVQPAQEVRVDYINRNDGTKEAAAILVKGK